MESWTINNEGNHEKNLYWLNSLECIILKLSTFIVQLINYTVFYIFDKLG